MNQNDTFSANPEIEARIVAWVLGEASPFEAAELARLIEAQPELAIFKRRIEAVHGLLGESAREDASKSQLSPDRRAKLLAALSGAPESSVLALKPLHSANGWKFPVWGYALASGLVAGLFVLISISQSHFTLPRQQSSPVSRLSMEVAESKMKEEVAGREKALMAARAAELRRKERAENEEIESRDIALAEESAKRLVRPDPSATVMGPAPGEVVKPESLPDLDATNSKTGASLLAQVGSPGHAWNYDAGRVTLNRTGSYNTAPRTFHHIDGNSATGALALNGRVVSSGGALQNKALAAGAGELVTGNQFPEFDDAGNEIVKLSPFEVNADRESGYAAANTLAGTRVNTPLRDVGSTINVVPDHFLEDVGATDKDAVLDYTAKKQKPSGRPTLPQVDQPVAHPAAPADDAARGDVSTEKQSVSTFSLHVSDVSFRLAQAALNRGERPDPNTIRPEEFYNAFDYGDPAPAGGEPVSCRIEQSADPFLQQRNLVRIALEVPATGRAAGQPLHLTVLLDTSGSMEREDRTESVRAAFSVLASLLGPNDQVTLIGFARQPRLLAVRVKGTEAAKLVDVVAHTPADGGTNFEEALKLAGEQAMDQYDPAAQNRIVALSDGAANLGNDDPAHLAEQVAALRQHGIAFDACGVGVEGLDDSVLEALTRKGDGRYYVLNSPDEADAAFGRKLAGALRPAAQNVKVQVRFNPARVQSYRLIGFEQHRLRTEDFRNDQVNAAELAGDEAGVALYQVEVRPEGEGELGDVYVRFRNPATGAMVERSWTLRYTPQVSRFADATPSMQLAGTSALLAAKLRGGAPAAQIRLSELAPAVNRLRGAYAADPRVQDFVTMFNQARRVLGE